MASFECRTAARKRRVEETEKSLIAEEQRKKRLREEKENRRVEEANAQRRSEEIAEQKRIEEQRRVEELEMQKKLEAQKREQEEAEQIRKQKELEEKIRLEEARLRKIIQDAEQKKCEDAQEIKQLQQSEQQLKRMCNELLVKCNEATEELDKVKMSEIKLSTKIDALSEAVFDFVKKGLPENQFLGCSHFDQFLLTVIKFRLTIGDQDLAYRFGINQSTVSRCVARWLDILYTKLSPLIYWPDREQLLKIIPTCLDIALENVQS